MDPTQQVASIMSALSIRVARLEAAVDSGGPRGPALLKAGAIQRVKPSPTKLGFGGSHNLQRLFEDVMNNVEFTNGGWWFNGVEGDAIYGEGLKDKAYGPDETYEFTVIEGWDADNDGVGGHNFFIVYKYDDWGDPGHPPHEEPEYPRSKLTQDRLEMTSGVRRDIIRNLNSCFKGWHARRGLDEHAPESAKLRKLYDDVTNNKKKSNGKWRFITLDRNVIHGEPTVNADVRNDIEGNEDNFYIYPVWNEEHQTDLFTLVINHNTGGRGGVRETDWCMSVTAKEIVNSLNEYFTPEW